MTQTRRPRQPAGHLQVAHLGLAQGSAPGQMETTPLDLFGLFELGTFQNMPLAPGKALGTQSIFVVFLSPPAQAGGGHLAPGSESAWPPQAHELMWPSPCSAGGPLGPSTTPRPELSPLSLLVRRSPLHPPRPVFLAPRHSQAPLIGPLQLLLAQCGPCTPARCLPGGWLSEVGCGHRWLAPSLDPTHAPRSPSAPRSLHLLGSIYSENWGEVFLAAGPAPESSGSGCAVCVLRSSPERSRFRTGKDA